MIFGETNNFPSRGMLLSIPVHCNLSHSCTCKPDIYFIFIHGLSTNLKYYVQGMNPIDISTKKNMHKQNEFGF